MQSWSTQIPISPFVLVLFVGFIEYVKYWISWISRFLIQHVDAYNIGKRPCSLYVVSLSVKHVQPADHNVSGG